MKCYWTVNSSYWPPLRVNQYEVNTSWPPQQVNSFTILKTKNQFILLCWKKQLWCICTNFWINPHNGKLPSRLAPAQCQNSLTPQLLSNIYWSKTKTSISLNRVYWYDTMCHIFSCYHRHGDDKYDWFLCNEVPCKKMPHRMKRIMSWTDSTVRPIQQYFSHIRTMIAGKSDWFCDMKCRSDLERITRTFRSLERRLCV